MMVTPSLLDYDYEHDSDYDVLLSETVGYLDVGQPSHISLLKSRCFDS